MKYSFLLLLALTFHSSFATKGSGLDVIYPKDGDTLKACQPIEIEVYSNYWFESQANYLYYSVDSGSTWTRAYKFARVSAYGTEYVSWAPPKNATTGLMLRFGTGSSGLCESVFTIVESEPLNKIISPNGGESFGTKSEQTINWSTYDTTTRVGLSCSSDDGLTWKSIGLYPDTGSCKWTIPSTASASYKLKVEDYNTCSSDESDNTFEVFKAPFIEISTMKYQNTYEGNSVETRWNAENLTNGSVDLFLSTDSGITWTTIGAKILNTGRHIWTIPNNINSPNCLVKAQATSSAGIYDITEPFEVYPTQLYFNGINEGDTLFSCELKNLYPKKYGDFGSNTVFDLSISIDGGITWKEFNNGYNIRSSYNYSAPKGESKNCFIRAISRGDTVISSFSEKFTIENRTSQYINLISPQKGDSFGTGESVNIILETDYINSKNIYLSTDGGFNWDWKGRIYHQDTTPFTIPNTVSDSCVLAVSVNDCISDTTKGYFSVFSESNLAINPSSYSSLYGFNNISLNWQTVNGSGIVNIDYSIDGGVSWLVADTNVVDDGSHSFKLPNDSITKFTVRISDASNPNISDQIDQFLTIIPSLIWFDSSFTPEAQYTCSYMDIPNDYIGRKANHAYLSQDSGATWLKLETERLGSFFPIHRVKLPNSTINSDLCFIKITDSDSSIEAVSPMFSFNNALELRNLNGGEYVGLGERLDVRWYWPNGNTYDYLNISLSKDSGQTWENLTSYTENDGYYESNYLQEDTSFKAMVSVTSSDDNCIADTSTNVFSISTLSGNERLRINNVQIKHWKKKVDTLAIFSHHLYTECVKIEISYDNENSWETIEKNWTLDHDSSGYSYYAWHVPDTTTAYNRCKLRIRECNNSNAVWISDAFTIKESYYTVYNIKRADSFQGCTPHNITWNGQGISMNATLYYSLDNRESWIPMEGNYNYFEGYGSLDWEFPNIDASGVWTKIQSNEDINDSLIIAPVYINSVGPISIEHISPTENVVLNSHEKEPFQWNRSGDFEDMHIKFYNLNWDLITTQTSSEPSSDSIYIESDMSDTVNILVQDQFGCSIDTLLNVSINNSPFIESNITDYSPMIGTDEVSLKVNYGNLPEGANRVNISYSYDGRTYWAGVRSNMSKNTSYTWNVPNIGSDSVVFRYQAFGTYDTVTFYSKQFKILKKGFKFITPAKDQFVYGCDKEIIKWKNIYPLGEKYWYQLYYSLDAGENWQTPVNSLYTTVDSAGITTFNWSAPGIKSSSKCLFKIVDVNNTSTYAISDTFEVYINPNSKIENATIVGEDIYELDSVTINWEATADIDSIELMWYEIVSPTHSRGFTSIIVPNTGTAKIIVPNINKTHAYVNVSDARSCAWTNTGDVEVKERLTIDMYVIDWRSEYVPNSSLWIQYNSDGIMSDSLSLEYSYDNGATWIFDRNVSNTYLEGRTYGRTGWTANEALVGKTVILRLSDYKMPRFNGSIGQINIVPHRTFFSYPSQQSVYEPNQLLVLNWSSTSNKVDSLSLEFSNDGGKTWSVIDSTVTLRTNNFNWYTPSINSSECKLRLRSDSILVESVTFTIQPGRYYLSGIDSTSELDGCSVTNINWGGLESSSNATVLFSSNYGQNWEALKTYNNIKQGSRNFDWTTPNIESEDCYIKIKSNINPSDSLMVGPFTIHKNSISVELIEPTLGKDSIFIFDSVTVSWTSSQNIDSVHIYWRDYAHAHWVSMSGGLIANTGKFIWRAPKRDSYRCYVKVVDPKSDCVESDVHQFVIYDRPYISFVENKSLIAGDSLYLTVTSYNIISDSLKIEYSKDGGLTWFFIRKIPNKTSNSYNERTNSIKWFIDNSEIGQQYIFRMTDIDNPKSSFISEPLDILDHYCNLSLPSEGDVYETNSSEWAMYDIARDTGTTFYLEFSPDGGKTWEILYSEPNEYGFYEERRWTTPMINSNQCIMRVRTGDCISESGLFTIGSPVSVNNIDNNQNGYLFPNPTDGNVYLKGFNNVESVRVYNTNGALIKNYKGFVNEINVEELPNGFYFVKINSASELETRRLIKLK